MPNVQCFEVVCVPESKDAGKYWLRPDTGEEQPYPSRFGPGAIYHNVDDEGMKLHHDSADNHYAEHFRFGPDGHILSVVLPSKEVWTVDEASTDGKFWERSGTIPNVTATPSILTPKYHGHLTVGILKDA